ncbi:MAG: dCTP deaminase [Alphaproteobacteria bacterium]|nr:dCTP deaminase [Alphaproteobacteria bacterium]
MLLTLEQICDRIVATDDALSIVPLPSIADLRRNGGASLDLRLGRWFLTVRQSSSPFIDVDGEQAASVGQKSYFVPFDSAFYLHPGRFVLGITLEWLRLPNDIASYVTGKSSWGRRGLIIETASGIHPGFSGCLALELANVGELPIALRPGMPICQIFMHETATSSLASSSFDGHRRPVLGKIQKDSVLTRLSASSELRRERRS